MLKSYLSPEVIDGPEIGWEECVEVGGGGRGGGMGGGEGRRLEETIAGAVLSMRENKVGSHPR